MLKKLLSAMFALSVLLLPSTLATADTTIEPIADSFVQDTQPNTNFGTENRLQVTEHEGVNGPDKDTFLKFNVPTGLSGREATLHLTYIDNTGNTNPGINLYHVANDSWTETGITKSNAPTFSGSSIATDSDPTDGVDLTFTLPEDGTLSLALITVVNNGHSADYKLKSRESSTPPTLTIADAPVTTPTPTPTATPTPIPTTDPCESTPEEVWPLTATVTGNSVLVDWEEPTGTEAGGCDILDYHVINWNTTAGPGQYIRTDYQTFDTELTITGLTDGTYTVDLHGCNALGCGDENSTDYVVGTTPTPTPTITPTPEPTATPTPEPTPTPTPEPTATATPTPEPTPTPTPPPSGAGCDTIVGYGSGVTGGTNLVLADTFAEVKSGAESGGNRVVITGDAVLDGNGAQINPASNTTVTRAAGSTAVLWNTWFKISDVNNVVLDDLVVRTGDEDVQAMDADPISITSASGEVTTNVAVTNVEATGGPDVGGITVLSNGGVTEDITIQCSIIGSGLFRSNHPEANQDASGHSYTMNLSGITPGAAPERVTVYRNLLTNSFSRNPRVCGSEFVDFVNNVIYNYRNPPECNPKGLNMVNNVLREGPGPEDVGLNESAGIFKPSTSGDFPSQFSNAIYEAGTVCEHAESIACTRQGSSSVYRTTPYGTLSVTPGPADRADILSTVGPTTRDTMGQQWIDDVNNRTGEWFNGVDGPAPIFDAR